MNARQDLERAFLDGDAERIVAAVAALQNQAAVDRAVRIADLRAELAEMAAERPELVRRARETREAAIVAQEGILAAQTRAGLAAREAGAAHNAITSANDKQRRVEAELDELLAAIHREVGQAETPYVRSLLRRP